MRNTLNQCNFESLSGHCTVSSGGIPTTLVFRRRGLTVYGISIDSKHSDQHQSSCCTCEDGDLRRDLGKPIFPRNDVRSISISQETSSCDGLSGNE